MINDKNIENMFKLDGFLNNSGNNRSSEALFNKTELISRAMTTEVILKSLENIINIYDPWISSDYHLDSEQFKKYKEKRVYSTEELIERHNSVVKPDDLFFFLGDLSNGEKDASKEMEKRIIKSIESLNGKIVMIRGNNDAMTEEWYADRGILHICNEIDTGNYIFTHKPINASKNKINVHGHIHEGRNYYDLSPEYHMNVCVHINEWIPHKFSYYKDKYDKGEYDGVTVINS